MMEMHLKSLNWTESTKNENELHLREKYVLHIIDCSDIPQIEIDILFSTSLRRIRFLFVLS